MTKRDDGGPAFPTNETSQFHAYPGMSLRDWFAGQALAAMSAASDYSSGPCNASVAERAYDIADAMLAERARGGQP